ncbi:hypothetical protein E5S69_11590 [Cupriavidus necator]|uniref:hypothetical protein n=1 Tax=Cupriavidus necator TaxID=106590 RepID=UPI0014902627|nr:hypothetical protein [Cupriavidus necator]NOV24154.1 hypothetical protein [Cupriavidus necator]
MLEAAQEGMQQIQQEAALKVTRANLQVVRTAAMENRVTDLMARFGDNRTKSFMREMDLTSQYIEGIKRENMASLMDLLDAAESRQGVGPLRRGLMFLFDAENPGMTRDLAVEIIANANGSTGNQLAQKGARAWLDAIERMRQRFNAAGGDVGKLDYGYLPQPHDSVKVRGDGSTAARDKWAQDTLPLLDRSQYVREDGTRMNDAEVLDFLRESWETIATEGLNKTAPGSRPAPGSASRANAGSQTRQIHYKDGAAYLNYMAEYGAGSMFDAMVGHVGRLSRDIGLVERYGPNPNQQFRLQSDLAVRADGERAWYKAGPQGLWNVLSGVAASPKHGNLAQVAQHVRNVEVFGKLGGALVTSLTDIPSFFVTTGFNNLSYWEALRNIPRQFDSNTRDFLSMHGVIAESMASDLARWSGDNLGHSWSGRLANSTMKLSLLNAWTDTLRRAFSMTMMNGMAKLSKTDWKALTEYDRWRMENKGITEADWDVIRQAQLTQHNGMDFLTPESIRAAGDPRSDEVVAKVLGLITDESEYAVLNPDLQTKALASWGGKQRGTLDGELARSVMQFKSFPIAMISRHWGRVMDTPGGMQGAPLMANRVVYGAGMLMVTGTILGAIVTQTKELLNGKDPIDMSKPKFWFKAFTQGGGAGFLGDVLLRDSSSDMSPQQGLFELLGPSFGSLAQFYELTKGNIDEAVAGKDTHVGAEALRFAKGHSPYLNLWYAKSAIDHAGLHAMQESLSPGYLARMKQRAQNDWDQSYWWNPGTGLPGRAPDFSAAFSR